MKHSPLFLLFALALSSLQAAEPITPFNGKDLSGWEVKKEGATTSKWTVGKAQKSEEKEGQLSVKPEGSDLANITTAHGQSLDIYSLAKFGDVHLEIELMVPKGSNSGIYVMGEYEVQVLDSYGKADKDMSAADIGAIYSAAVPKLNASKEPGVWQKFIIDFRAPKFDSDGKKTANAVFVKVELNGKLLHENVEMKGPTPGGLTGQEHAEGPIMFQGNHGAVAYRNIRITPLEKK
jgi:hypothetical protein